MDYIAIFNNNPTDGGTDGSEVSQDRVMNNPISAVVNSGDSKIVKCAVRCVSGYHVSGDLHIAAVIYDEETGEYERDYDYIKVSDAEDGSYSSSIDLSNVGDTNKVFWVKIFGMNSPGTLTAGLRLEGTVVANA